MTNDYTFQSLTKIWSMLAQQFKYYEAFIQLLAQVALYVGYYYFKIYFVRASAVGFLLLLEHFLWDL